MEGLQLADPRSHISQKPGRGWLSPGSGENGYREEKDDRVQGGRRGEACSPEHMFFTDVSICLLV